MDISSAKAVITGGASGLGLATAERVVEAGGKEPYLITSPAQLPDPSVLDEVANATPALYWYASPNL